MDSRLVNKYISFVDDISNIYKYDNNIKHLLYLIVPAFVSKYSIYDYMIINIEMFNGTILSILNILKSIIGNFGRILQ